MGDYRHILLASDFSDGAAQVAQRAADLAARYQSRLSAVHVVDYLPVADSAYGPSIPFDPDLTDQLIDAARQRLATLAEPLGVAEDARWVEIGSPKLEIVRVAEEKEVDLIVIGSHGKHGLQLLLGSTATGVLHHARCDVLAVRLFS
jgi:universal stress protein A